MMRILEPDGETLTYVEKEYSTETSDELNGNYSHNYIKLNKVPIEKIKEHFDDKIFTTNGDTSKLTLNIDTLISEDNLSQHFIKKESDLNYGANSFVDLPNVIRFSSTDSKVLDGVFKIKLDNVPTDEYSEKLLRIKFDNTIEDTEANHLVTDFVDYPTIRIVTPAGKTLEKTLVSNETTEFNLSYSDESGTDSFGITDPFGFSHLYNIGSGVNYSGNNIYDASGYKVSTESVIAETYTINDFIEDVKKYDTNLNFPPASTETDENGNAIGTSISAKWDVEILKLYKSEIESKITNLYKSDNFKKITDKDGISLVFPSLPSNTAEIETFFANIFLHDAYSDLSELYSDVTSGTKPTNFDNQIYSAIQYIYNTLERLVEKIDGVVEEIERIAETNGIDSEALKEALKDATPRKNLKSHVDDLISTIDIVPSSNTGIWNTYFASIITDQTTISNYETKYFTDVIKNNLGIISNTINTEQIERDETTVHDRYPDKEKVGQMKYGTYDNPYSYFTLYDSSGKSSESSYKTKTEGQTGEIVEQYVDFSHQYLNTGLNFLKKPVAIAWKSNNTSTTVSSWA